jgi:BlaI family penicillinase repressor
MAIPRISDAEWEIMKVIWLRSSCSAHEIIAALEPSRDWSVGTVKKLINRLHSKGALRFEKVGKAYIYYPLVKEDIMCAAKAESFIDRIFGGELSPMIAHFARTRKLSSEDLDGLERILKQGRKKS